MVQLAQLEAEAGRLPGSPTHVAVTGSADRDGVLNHLQQLCQRGCTQPSAKAGK